MEERIWVSERKPTSSAQAGQLAEDYLQARKATGKLEAPKRVDKRAAGSHCCHSCGEVGHFRRDCEKRAPAGSNTPAEESQDRPQREVCCYNCGRRGQMAMCCPSKPALYCGESLGRPETVREGLVEGHQVQGILLDTGCTRTLVQQDLVPPGKMTVGRVSIRCAHGDVVS